ncbi:MAG TPA: PPE family protein [Mycobacterium sp.]|nr:PPE family protein [Mycobacterium sp.]
MDFGTLPPEVTSAQLYAGAGPAPMLAAASAWDKMAAEIWSAFESYESIIAGLANEGWMGPASTAMAAAAAPFVTWLRTTAKQAEQTATQAKAAVAAYDAAHAAIVPPAAVAANHTQLAALTATNFLGQNGPAIAANEAQYGAMWANNTATMYGYAANSAAATKVTPFGAPMQNTNPGGQANQAAAVAQANGSAAGSSAQSTLSQAISATPNALQAMASPAQSGAVDPFFENIASIFGLQPGDVANAMSNIGSSSFTPMSLAGITQIGADAAVMHSVANGGVVGPFHGIIPGWGGIDELLPPAGIQPSLLAPGSGISAVTPGAMGIGGLASQVSAGVGKGTLVGSLSVPPSWAASIPTGTPPAASTALVSSWASAAPAAEAAGMPGMPGMPFAGAGAGRGFGLVAPRYGFKPTVMARPVVAG